MFISCKVWFPTFQLNIFFLLKIPTIIMLVPSIMVITIALLSGATSASMLCSSKLKVSSSSSRLSSSIITLKHRRAPARVPGENVVEFSLIRKSSPTVKWNGPQNNSVYYAHPCRVKIHLLCIYTNEWSKLTVV